MRITPDARHVTSTGGNAGQTSNKTNKGRKRTLSGQEQPMDEPTDAIKAEPTDGVASCKSWTIDTADLITVGEVYTQCAGADARLPLTYFWERRSKLEMDSPSEHSGYDAVSLLRALVNVAKSSLTKGQPVGGSGGSGNGGNGSGGGGGGGGNGQENQMPGSKKLRRQIIPLQMADQPGAVVEQGGAAQSPVSESSPSHGALSMESPVQVCRWKSSLICLQEKRKDSFESNLIVLELVDSSLA